MNLAILHYHLNRGGVTQVIFNQLKALDQHLVGERWRCAILFGGRHDAWLEDLKQLNSIDVTLCRLPHLDYDWSKGLPQPEVMGQQIAEQLERLDFTPAETILHAHNHSLGLNVSLPGSLLWLAERGFPLLLQLHDFCEDYRPFCFQRAVVASKAARQISRRRGCAASGQRLPSDLPAEFDTAFCYPQASHVHYATINGRDHDVLSQAGIPDDRLHLLPNPVTEPGDRMDRENARQRLRTVFDVPLDDQYVLYPVRCIRRKNVGEALLWSALAPPRTTFGLTLPPENAICAAAYEGWKRLAHNLDLPCLFEVGREGGLRYPENVAAADLLMTTSLVEGFGMVFLESWLTDHTVAGRDLPEITSDFTKSGLIFDSLEPEVPTPLDWIGHRQFSDMLRDGYNRVLRDYGVSPRPDGELLERRIQRQLDRGFVDFGELDEELQSTVIEKTIRSARSGRQLEELNPTIPISLKREPAARLSAASRNATTVREGFGLPVSGDRLYQIYQRISASERQEDTSPLAEPGTMIDHYLDARRYRPIAS